jgi:predicted transcriptional regulator of viral defense system
MRELTIQNKILENVKKAKRGTLFFTDNFSSLGTAKTINKALERLEKKNVLTRVARGIYTCPKVDALLGPLLPTIEEVAKAIAKRDKARIIPTGSYALNSLGLSTQVPMNVVFLTDGTARTIRIGNNSITFKKTSPRNLAASGPISSLVIQALKAIGKDQVSEEQVRLILDQLKKENQILLDHDISIAPEWIREIMRQALL